MLDHIGISASDYRKSRAFYADALMPLGIDIVMEVTREETGGYEGVGFGTDRKPWFWIGADGKPGGGTTHIAFAADSRAAVDRFYAAAIAAGGRDNGPPGLRTDYHPDYYAAFVLDPDGNNVEAVCHAPA
jgi:catechol 2,3-dioxygenase-like lactoylglutathione lyase family enzyme